MLHLTWRKRALCTHPVSRLALSSHHPLAAALARLARVRNLCAGAVEEPGQGVRAIIDGTDARLGSASFCGIATDAYEPQGSDASFITFAHDGATITIPIRQTLRPDAVAVIGALHKHGLDLVILPGDRLAAVAPVAKELGIADLHAGLKPAEKIAKIDALKAKGRRVLMVGDGLNDAPALAAAHVSMSPITAAHLTQTHADALFLGDLLRPVLQAVAMSRRARRLMQENLVLAVVSICLPYRSPLPDW